MCGSVRSGVGVESKCGGVCGECGSVWVCGESVGIVWELKLNIEECVWCVWSVGGCGCVVRV